MRLVAAAAVALALAGGAPAAAAPVLGFDWPSRTLAWFDPATLARVASPRPDVADNTCDWAFSPDGAAVALAGCNSGSLRLVDVRRMKLLGDVQPADHFYSWIVGLAWLRADRLLAVADRTPVSDVLVIDASTRRVVKTVPLRGSAWGTRVVGDELVVLVGKHGGYTAARVVVVDADGATRTVTLGRVSIGNIVTYAKTGEPRTRTRTPGFTVDPDGGRAFVVNKSLVVAEIDVASLAVTYHELARRTLQKSIEGPQRLAEWLGDGKLVIGGGDWKAGKTETAKPIGIQFVDTRDWTSRTIDAHSLWYDVIGGLIGVNGEGARRTYVVYGADGAPRWRTTLGVNQYVELQAGRGYVCDGDRLLRILDPATGTTTFTPTKETQCVRLLDR
jgi:hypothetical protein